MKATVEKLQSLKTESHHQESNDLLGLSMLSLAGFQIYHICDKKLFPYSLMSERALRKSTLR